MPKTHTHLSRSRAALYLTLVALFASLGPNPATLRAQQQPEILPLSQVRPGMQGYAYTIFAGDQIEKFDLEVIGVLDNFLGPKQSIILAQLKGPKVEHTGVVAGMSGSPVYLDGKLAGALSLKLGIFTKEPIAGITPIQDVLNSLPSATAPTSAVQSSLPRFGVPPETSLPAGLPSGTALEPIETPLVFSGFQPATLRQFAGQLEGYGLVAAQGGTAKPSPQDAHLVAGDMAGMVLVQGDASISSACTVTAVEADRVYLCGHPFMNLGDIQLPMARSRVLTTLSSDLASTKIVNVAGSIGTITSDHLTAVTGRLGAAPPMIPLDLTLHTSTTEKKLHFDIVSHPKLTPTLVAVTIFNGLTQNSAYGEGTTLHLTGEIRLQGHAPVQIDNTFAPVDNMTPDGMPIPLTMQSVFGRLFSNTFEPAKVDSISLRVESVPGRKSFSIESAWLEKGEAAPGETLRVRVLLHPYRGAPRVEETTVRIPEQAARGTTLRVLVSDADFLNRASRGFGFFGGSGPTGLDQLISLLNRERRNDRLYVGLFVPSPTLLWEDKELTNIPLSQISVVDAHPTPGGMQVLRESLAGEASIPLGGPVTGIISLNLQIR